MSRSILSTLPTLSLSTLLAALLLGAACGDAPPMQMPREPDLSPPPAGKVALVVPRAKTPVRDLRAVVLWSSYDLSDIFKPKVTNIGVSADVAVSADVPSRVLLDIEEIKKGPTSGEGKLVFGTPIVYEDTNKNGRLDLAQNGDAAPIDRLLGTSDHMVYAIAVEDGAPEGTAPALHLIRVPDTAALPPVCEKEMPGAEELPLETVIQIPLDGTAPFELALCDELTIDTEAACDLTNAEVRCNADYSGFVATMVQDQGTACAHRVSCQSRECPAPSERPDYCPAR